MTGQELRVTVCRDGETYLFVYTESNRTQLLRLLGEMAANPKLSFSWYDAACVSELIRRGECMCGLCTPSLSEATSGMLLDEDCEGI